MSGHVRAWVIDGQSIYCIHGKPKHFNIKPSDLPLPTLPAIDRLSAKQLGLCLTGEFIPHRSLIAHLTVKLAHELCRAIWLLSWHNTHQYCPQCGAFLLVGLPKSCPTCQHQHYPTISPCVIVAITRICPTTQKPQILLAKHHRRTDIYTLIAGFVEVGETPEMAVHREVFEEVGIWVDNVRYVSSQPWPYPNNLMMGFVAEYRLGDITPQADEISDARFFEVDNLPPIAPLGTLARQLIDGVCQHI